MKNVICLDDNEVVIQKDELEKLEYTNSLFYKYQNRFAYILKELHLKPIEHARDIYSKAEEIVTKMQDINTILNDTKELNSILIKQVKGE